MALWNLSTPPGIADQPQAAQSASDAQVQQDLQRSLRREAGLPQADVAHLADDDQRKGGEGQQHGPDEELTRVHGGAFHRAEVDPGVEHRVNLGGAGSLINYLAGHRLLDVALYCLETFLNQSHNRFACRGAWSSVFII